MSQPKPLNPKTFPLKTITNAVELHIKICEWLLDITDGESILANKILGAEILGDIYYKRVNLYKVKPIEILGPDEMPIWNYLKKSYYERESGDKNKALEYYHQAIELCSNKPQFSELNQFVLQSIAKCHYEMNQIDRCIEIFEKLFKIYGENGQDLNFLSSDPRNDPEINMHYAFRAIKYFKTNDPQSLHILESFHNLGSSIMSSNREKDGFHLLSSTCKKLCRRFRSQNEILDFQILIRYNMFYITSFYGIYLALSKVKKDDNQFTSDIANEELKDILKFPTSPLTYGESINKINQLLKSVNSLRYRNDLEPEILEKNQYIIQLLKDSLQNALIYIKK